MWASEHRRHHKHVDHDDDPYCISKGLFPRPHRMADLQTEFRAALRQRCRSSKRQAHLSGRIGTCNRSPLLVSLGVPSILGFLWNGWHGALGGVLIAGVARIVALQHCTFLINSACHTIGRQPYSTKCSARDSLWLAFFTFGEGYHNYHHEFQHDYRNGVKPWQFDPTKWIIWTLSKLGFAKNLRRVPAEKIRLAEDEVRG